MRKRIVISVFFVIVFITLAFLLSHILTSEQDAEPQNVSITEADRLDEYLSREEYPENVVTSLEYLIKGDLSKGDFDDLDEQLRKLSESYRNTSDQSSETNETIDSYRADIAYYEMIKGAEQPLDNWYFKNPDVLAAAVAYAPVSVKYKALLNRDSALLPPAGADINLRESGLTNEEKRILLEEINNQRTKAAQFTMIDAYDMTIATYACRFYAVMDSDSFLYQPYAVLVLEDENFDVTAALADFIIENDSDSDLDAMFTAPVRTDGGVLQ